MHRFSEQRARWAVVFWMLVVPLLLLASCATVPSSRKYVGPVFDSETSAQIEESFPDLWESRTVHFDEAAGGGRPWRLSTPFSMAGGKGYGGGSDEFPLQIAATLMDSLLIEAGLRHYATMLAMTPEERAAFRNAYCRRYEPTNHLLIWCNLGTTWAENYLDRDRWSIFLEDDTGKQYGPVRILEESQPIHPMVTDRSPGFQPERGRWGWEVHQKTLMLCFSRRDVYGNIIQYEDRRF